MVRRLIASCLQIMLVAAGTAAAGSITLNQGANITVTAPDTFDTLAFDLGGQIWLRSDKNESASPLTASGEFNQRPSFSRDGRFIAYESLQKGFRQIFVSDVENSVTRQVTFGPYDHLAPAWSTMDSARHLLAMSSNRGGTFDIWEVDVDTLELNQLTFAAADEFEPAWNDDGSRLAYVAAAPGGSSLYILIPGEKPRLVLHERTRIAAPAWRPGGGLLTYTRENGPFSQLRMLILSTPVITKAITNYERVSPRPAHWLNRGEFLYSADGRIRHREFGLPTFKEIPFNIRIEIHQDTLPARSGAFVGPENRSVLGIDGRARSGDGRIVVAALSDLWELKPGSDDRLRLVRQLTNDAFIDAQPAFSPSEKRLAFVSDRSGRPEIWTMELDTGVRQRLTRDDGVIGYPTWSPNGSAVAYLVTDERHGYRLHLADLVDRQIQTLPATSAVRGRPAYSNGTWIITGIDGPPGISPGASRLPLPLIWRPATGSNRYIVRAGRIFDGIGPQYLMRQDIVIENGLIIAIRPWSDSDPGIPVIDASTQTVIPGMIDLAVRQAPVDTERHGRKWLAAGVTTIRMTVDIPPDGHGVDFDRAVERLESWSSGRRLGPRLMIALRLCHDDSGRFDGSWFASITRQAEALNIVAVEPCPGLAGAALNNIVEKAREHRLSVIATTPIPGMTPGATELSPDALMSTQSPNPAIWHDFLQIGTVTGAVIPSRLITASWRGLRLLEGLNTSWQYRRIFTSVERRRFNASWSLERAPQTGLPPADPNRILGAGAGIALGSEAPSTPRGLGLHGELRRLVSGNLRTFQVLKLAGLDAARLLGFSETLGTVRVGRLADLVMVDGDPLADIDDAVKVTGTIVNGRYYSRRDLATPGFRGIGRPGVGKLYNSRRR